MENDYDHNKLEVEKLCDEKVMAFTEIISKEVDDKLNYIKIHVERILNDIKETVGEFKVNITRQMNFLTPIISSKYKTLYRKYNNKKLK